jgi:glycosyltransferase involved in cell wall biosynthesis
MTHDIVMPFYGRVDHFQTAVRSVLAQSDEDWRLLVIDDAYPDPSAGVWLSGLGDDRIEYVRNDENVGINVNFQRSIDLAEHDWLTIFGCDDVMLPGYVQEMKRLADSYPDAALLHPASRVIDADGRVVRPLVDRVKAHYRPTVRGEIELRGEDFAVSITRGNWMNFPAIAWRREVVAGIGFQPGLNVVQDLALALDVCLAGGSLVVSDEVVFEYRRHAASVSSWRAVDGSRFREEQAFFTLMSDVFQQHGWDTAARVARRHVSSRVNAVTQVPGALAHRDFGGAGILMRHALGVTAR